MSQDAVAPHTEHTPGGGDGCRSELTAVDVVLDCKSPSLEKKRTKHGPRAFHAPNYGIFRRDCEASASYGWQVTIIRRGRTYNKFFADAKSGGKAKALMKALSYRDELSETIAPLTRGEYSRIKRKSNKSGTPGVCRYTQSKQVGDVIKEHTYWIAFWPTERGRSARKKFSVNKHGEDGAYFLALEAREAASSRLGEPYCASEKYAEWLSLRSGSARRV